MDNVLEIEQLGRMFSKPKISAYDFLKGFIAELAINNIVIIPRSQITSTLFDYSKNEKYKPLFEDIGFNQYGDTVTSYDIEDSIANLQVLGMIGKLNPSFERIVIYLDKDLSKNICDSFDEDTRQRIESLVRDFIKQLNRGQYERCSTKF
ncbi:MAG: hypothetical protein GXY17_03525 [Clostridiaceae bacterium]|nr:hypothetical protein [Clostridiaceae bacterium]